MMSIVRWRDLMAPVCLAASLILGGCNTVPTSIVRQPTSVLPAPLPAVPPAASGTIFQSAHYRPLFEDYRARIKGDTLVIIIAERSTVGKASANTSTKSSGISASVDRLFGMPATTAGKLGLQADGSRKSEDKDSADSQNSFDSTLTASVIDVLENGKLVISGEKQVALDKGVEFIRFSGIVNPAAITGGNTVYSHQVADARAEYRTNTQVDKSLLFSAMTRFFFSVLPL
jgi:flagellar L-ring protein precursor FlgH